MNPVVWFEIYVQDMTRARTFYETVLKRELQHLPMAEMEMWSFPMEQGMTAPGASGALVCMPGVPSGGMGTLVYFGCEDCAIEASRVVAAGGKVEREKMSINEYGFIALCYDTEGNMFGLHSMK